MSKPSPTVAIVGLGLLGGSVARALAQRAPDIRILAADKNEEAIAQAHELGVIDRAGGASEIVTEADVIVYATPLDVVLELIRAHAGSWRDDALVMDVASLKAPVLDAVRASATEASWIGAHPMAGSERAGFGAATADLFEDVRIWLVSARPAHPGAERAESFWRSLGGVPDWTDAELHDRLMVAVSHLPQLTSNALASLLDGLGVHPAEMGSGGRAMTRLAGSDPGVWSPLLDVSATELDPLLRGLAKRLEALAEMLDPARRGELAALMEETRAWKERIGWS